MSKLKHKRAVAFEFNRSAALALIICACFFLMSSAVGAWARFERTYTVQGPAHLIIKNINGDVRVVSWDKKSITVRATTGPSVTIEDHKAGDDITVSVKHRLPQGRAERADFEAFVPAETSLSMESYVGKIEVQGVAGHVSVNSFESDVHLINVRAPSVDVKVTNGDVFFDGELRDTGSYSLQSMKGDIDVSLPAETSFNLIARALNENINLGDFLSNFSGGNRGPKGLSGSFRKGGARLTLTTYDGRILFHKK